MRRIGKLGVVVAIGTAALSAHAGEGGAPAVAGVTAPTVEILGGALVCNGGFGRAIVKITNTMTNAPASGTVAIDGEKNPATSWTLAPGQTKNIDAETRHGVAACSRANPTFTVRVTGTGLASPKVGVIRPIAPVFSVPDGTPAPGSKVVFVRQLTQRYKCGETASFELRVGNWTGAPVPSRVTFDFGAFHKDTNEQLGYDSTYTFATGVKMDCVGSGIGPVRLAVPGAQGFSQTIQPTVISYTGDP